MHPIIFLFIALFSFNISSAKELKEISAEDFIAQNPSLERKEIVDFIIHQFDDKKPQKITQEQIDILWNNLEAREKFIISRFQIIDQKLYADSHDPVYKHFNSLKNFLQKLTKKYKIEDVDFIVYTVDEIKAPDHLKKETLKFPAFMMSKDLDDPYEKDKLLMPDTLVLIDYWNELISQIQQANLSNPWDKKIEKVFWRGATTGAASTKYSMENFATLPRLTLVMLSKSYPNLIDAKFASYHRRVFTKNSKKIMTLIKDDLQTAEEVDHLKYKYLISIDGNTCAWRRVPWILLSNSLLVKQETNKIEWFYPAIKPYVHYIPVDERLMNILPQIEWMKEQDDELKTISENATNFVENNLMPEHIEAHMVLILNEYHKLHKGEKIIATLPPHNQEPSMLDLFYTLFIRTKNHLTWWLESFF